MLENIIITCGFSLVASQMHIITPLNYNIVDLNIQTVVNMQKMNKGKNVKGNSKAVII